MSVSTDGEQTAGKYYTHMAKTLTKKRLKYLLAEIYPIFFCLDSSHEDSETFNLVKGIDNCVSALV